MAESGARIPQAQTDDNEDISWALSTAEAMWSRGDLLDAIKWVRRAAEAAGDAEQDERALELAKAAADLQNQLGGVGAQAASQPPPPPPPPSPNAPAAAAAAASTLAAHSAVTAPPPDGSSQPPPAASPSPIPPEAAITASPPSAAPSYPPPAPSFASGGRGPTTTSGTMRRPSSIPRPSGTPAAPAVARVSAPRPLAPRLSGAPPLPPAASASFAPPLPSPGLSSPPPLPNTTPSGVPAVSPPYFAPPVAPISSMPATARALEAADPASPASVPSEQEPTAPNVSPYPSNHPSAPPTVHAARAERPRDDDPTATSHDLEPPEDTAQIDVPVAPRRPSSKAPPPPPPPRPQLDTPSAQIDGSLVDATHTAEVRIARNPAEEIDAWPTQAIAGEDFADSNVSALVAALPPMRPREPSKHPMDPELLATQAVRVVVWRTPDGVRVAPAGTVVSAIACDAVLVALDPTADLSAWLTNKR